MQAKHPLLGLRFKNTTGANLAQGPVTVYEGSTYAGDARFLDISPNDERMIAFAIDLGAEVIPQVGDGKTAITKVKAQKGIVHVTRKQHDEKVYKISNKSDTARTRQHAGGVFAARKLPRPRRRGCPVFSTLDDGPSRFRPYCLGANGALLTRQNRRSDKGNVDCKSPRGMS